MARGWKTVLAATVGAAVLATGAIGAPPHHGPPRYSQLVRPLSSDEEQSARAFLSTFAPQRSAWLDSLETAAPDRYNLTMRRLNWLQRHLEFIAAQHDTATYNHELAVSRRMFGLQADAEDIALQYRHSTDPAVRAKLRTELTARLGRLFDLREQLRREETERMAKELDHLQAVVAERQRNRDSIVERRVEHMTGELDAQEW